MLCAMVQTPDVEQEEPDQNDWLAVPPATHACIFDRVSTCSARVSSMSLQIPTIFNL